MYDANKSDLSKLEYQVTYLIQGRKSVQEFYGEVYSHLTLIFNKIACMEINEEAYRSTRIITFVY